MLLRPLVLLLACLLGAFATDQTTFNLPCAANARAQIVIALVGAKSRPLSVTGPVDALETKWSLVNIDSSTFGFLASVDGNNYCSITSGLAVLTSPNNCWTAADVGKTIHVQGAGAAGATLVTTISAYTSPTSVTLATAASTTVTASRTSTAGMVMWGYDLGIISEIPPLTNPAGTLAFIRGVANAEVTINGVDRTLAEHFSDFKSVKDYGAVGDGVTNDTVAFQTALTAGGLIYIPPGDYLCGALTCSKRLYLYGAGAYQSRIVSTVTGANDALTITPPNNNTGNTFSQLRDFSIVNTVDGNGRHGLKVTLVASAYWSNWLIQGIYVGDFSSYGITLDNTVANTDGFFTGTIRRCWVTNGINGIKIGDSINIEENTLTGDGIGFLATGLSGAREVVLRSNNITNSGGCIALIGVDGARIYNNQCEQSGAYSGPYSAFMYLNSCNFAIIEDNTISAGGATGAAYGLLIDGAGSYNRIDKNDFSKGSVYHWLIDAPQASAAVGNLNNYDVTAVVGDNGSGTNRVVRGAASYDPPNLADGAGATTTITATGAVLGDFAQVSFSLDTQGIILTGWVSSSNVVSVRLQNETGAPIDLGTGTLRAYVQKQ